MFACLITNTRFNNACQDLQVTVCTIRSIEVEQALGIHMMLATCGASEETLQFRQSSVLSEPLLVWLQVLSNGRYRSAEHRGVYNKSKPRVSLIHFYSPDLDATLGPLEDIVDDTHPAVFKSFTYKDYHTTFVTMGLSGKSCIETFRIQK